MNAMEPDLSLDCDFDYKQTDGDILEYEIASYYHHDDVSESKPRSNRAKNKETTEDVAVTCGGGVHVSSVHIGTTHFVNAVVQRRHLERVAVIRLCGSATLALPPYSDFPVDLKQVVYGGVHLVDGGYQFDGQSEIAAVTTQQLEVVAQSLKVGGVDHVVVSGVFSPVNNAHEKQAAAVLQAVHPGLSITMSHAIGQLGLLERENAAVLNESLRPLARRTVENFREALHVLGLTCPFYLSQNDGTLLSAEQTLLLPVHTFASGPTNSMRGATFLSGVEDAVVVDVGGTTSDVGVIVKGFPREAGVKAKIGGVTTNFRMPDVHSIGLGGGSIVRHEKGDKACTIGPVSVGYLLHQEALVFGGQTLTSTDVAVAAGLAEIGQAERVAHLRQDLVHSAVRTIHIMLESAIDQVRVSSEDVTVVLVGGGSVLIDPSTPMMGVSKIVKPPSFQVANAVGAALSQVAGYVDNVVSLDGISRDAAIEQAKDTATTEAVTGGADPETIQVVDVMEVPLAYLPGNVSRVKVRVVGDLLDGDVTDAVTWQPHSGVQEEDNLEARGVTQVSSSTGGSLDTGSDGHLTGTIEKMEPAVDAESGEWVLGAWDVECIAVGAGVLGCGGGGSPEIGRLRALKVIEEGKVIRVIHPERMKARMSDADCVVPIGFMGAPTISIERLPSGTECLTALRAMEDLYTHGQYDDKQGALQTQDEVPGMHDDDGISYIDDYHPSEQKGATNTSRLVGLACFEIGGSNSMEPLLLGAETGLPVLDSDGMGRAFPELQMYTPMIYGHKPYPSTLADHTGRRAVVLRADTCKELEDHFRKVVCEMGCSGAIVGRALGRDDIPSKLVAYSMSRAWRLGQAILTARGRKESPINAIILHEGACLLGGGKIIDVDRQNIGGFARGTLQLEGLGDFAGKMYKVNFQNENLVASLVEKNDKLKVLACTPDLLAIVSTDSGQPVPTEEIRYGLRVSLLALPAPPELTTPRALEVVGPHAFGYPPEEVTYRPVGTYVQHTPIPTV